MATTIGITISIDVTKLDKDRLFVGKKGTYLNLTTFVALDKQDFDQYGNAGFVTQEQSKQERESKSKLPILGNVKIFFDNRESATPALVAPHQAGVEALEYLDDDIPF